MVFVLSEKPICAPPRLSEVSLTLLLKRFQIRLIDDGPLSSFEGRSSSASSFYASLLQAIDGEMSLAVCPQIVFQVPQHSALCIELVLEVCVYRNVICAIFKHSWFTGWHIGFACFLVLIFLNASVGCSQVKCYIGMCLSLTVFGLFAVVCVIVTDHIYIAPFSALVQTHCTHIIGTCERPAAGNEQVPRGEPRR